MEINLKEVFGTSYLVQDDGTNDHDLKERVWCMQIPGKYGYIYPHGLDGSLGVAVQSNHVRKRLERMGLEKLQGIDGEACFKFTSDDFKAVARIIKAKKRKQLESESQAKFREAGKVALARYRASQGNPTQNRGF